MVHMSWIRSLNGLFSRFQFKIGPRKRDRSAAAGRKRYYYNKNRDCLKPRVGRGQQTGRGTQRSWGVGQAEMAVCFPQGHFGLLPGGHKCLMFRGDPSSAPRKFLTEAQPFTLWKGHVSKLSSHLLNRTSFNGLSSAAVRGGDGGGSPGGLGGMRFGSSFLGNFGCSVFISSHGIVSGNV